MAWLSLVLVALAVQAFALFNIDATPNAVAVCYTVLHSLALNPSPPPDITDIENGVGTFGPVNAWHFWGRPDGGYYGGGDRAVLDRHFAQITDAGIDFIVIDSTNCAGYGDYAPGLLTEPVDALLDEMLIQRTAGVPTPHVVFWARSAATDPDPAANGRYIRDRYHSNSSYSDLWVTLGGAPLMITTDTLPDELAQSFTLRKMWGLQSALAEGEWSFLQDAPQNVGTTNGVAEEVSVCTAKQAGYITDKATATPRQQGATFQAQWGRAFDIKPKVVMLTWWNEWAAQRQVDDASGNPQFVDEYDSEYSKDIEPQDPSQPGSHGACYLDWTKAYIAAYKANQPIPGGLTGY